MATILTERQIDSIIRSSSIVDKSPKAYELLRWAVKKLDFTKVSSQADLTRWLRETIKEEASTYDVSPRTFAKRFVGMVKFFTNPSLGLEAVRELQTAVAEDMVSEIKSAISGAKDLEDLQRIYVSYKNQQFPPLAPTRLKQEYTTYFDRLRRAIAAIVSEPEYREILNAIKNAKQVVESGEYKKMPRVKLIEIISDLRRAKKYASDIRRRLNIPYKINERTINRYMRKLQEVVRTRRPHILRRRRLRRILRTI